MKHANISPMQDILSMVNALTPEEQKSLLENIQRRLGKRQIDEMTGNRDATQKAVREGQAAYGSFVVQRLSFGELSDRLHEYEQRYGYSTIEFYRRFQAGELGDDDDLMLWGGLYHLYLTSLPIRQLMQQEPAAL